MPPTKEDHILRGEPVGHIPDRSLSEFLLEKIKSHPKDNVFQVDSESGVTQTFREFLHISIQLAEGLKRIGVKENDVVALLCKNTFEASQVILGTWLTGGTVIPIDHSIKIAEMQHLFGLTKPKFVFCEEEVVDTVSIVLKLLSMTATIIIINGKKESSSSQLSFEDLLLEVDVDSYKPHRVKSPSTQLAIILCSSGTSGFPKGVGITHRNLIFQHKNFERHEFFQKTQSCLQISNFFWISGALTFFLCLTMGQRRVFIKNPNETNILKAIDKHKPEWTIIAPLVLLSVSTRPDFTQYDVSSIKALIVGGSPYTRPIAEKIKGQWDSATIIQMYGTTEVSGAATATDETGDVFSVGKVTSGVQVKVVDTATGESLKANTSGEICFHSPGLMGGYVGNEEATKECIDSEGWLHTGDLGYYDDSGQIYIVDRIKEMVKVKNMQVAPAEIEIVVMSIPGVQEAGVVGVTRDRLTYHLMALVVKEKGSAVTEEDICSHVENNLSDYKKLTAGVHFVQSLPKTASGKIRRPDLRKMAEVIYSGM